MATAAIVSLVLQLYLKMDSGRPRDFAYLMLITVGITTVVWLVVTLLTQPEPREKLIGFYRKVHPEGPGWKSIANEVGDRVDSRGLWIQIGNVLIYSTLFGIGKLVMKEWLSAVVFIVAAIISGVLISRNLSRIDWRETDTGRQ
jgi:hypothetical protein